MRIVFAVVALVFGSAMFLPAATTLPAFAQVAPSASVEPSASIAPSASSEPRASAEPSASLLPDARVQLQVGSEGEPTRDWAIAVTGGIPSVEVVTVPDQVDGYALFSVSTLGESATVELTATLPAGSQLTEATCFSYGEQVMYDALIPPRQLVLEVVPGGYYECTYGSNAPGPDRSSAEIAARKIVDADGNLTTVRDQRPGQGWEFDLELNNGAINEAFPMTNSDGLAGWLIFVGSSGTLATVTEAPRDDFELLDAFCMRIADNGDDFVFGEFDGSSISIEIDRSEFASYQCTFINARSPENGVGGQTLPPTDAVGPDRALGGDSWRVIALVLSGVLAAALVIAHTLGMRRAASANARQSRNDRRVS